MDTEDILEILCLDKNALSEEDVCMMLLTEQMEKDKRYGQFKKYLHFSVAKFSDEEFKTNFHFDKQGFKELYTALKIHRKYVLNDSCLTWDGDEGLAIMLCQLAYPNRLSDLVPLFGCHITELSCIANAMVKQIWTQFSHKLEQLDFEWINLEDFAEAVAGKGCPLDNVWGSIDGTLCSMCRPSEMQELYFSRHKRKHGLKYQSILCPNGLIEHCAGPVEGRWHDLYM